MDTILMNSKDSKISEPHRLLVNVFDKINLKRRNKYVSLANLSMYYIKKNIKKSFKDIKLISAPTWNENFQSHDGSHSVYSQKRKKLTDNPPKIRYLSKIENSIIFKTKRGYYLQLSTPQTMKLLGKAKSKETKNENSEKLSNLEIPKVV